jgi:CRISPR-associated protein Cas1
MEQGLTLGVDGELYAIERQGKLIEHVRMGEIDEVLVFGSVALTPAAIAAMLARGVDVVFLSARGRYRGRLVGSRSRNVELRLAQFERLRDPAFALSLAAGVVAGKVANQRNILLRAQREHKLEDLARAIGAMRQMLEGVGKAESVEALRGLEGQAAALYFGALGRCVRNPSFQFTQRSRRPPKDPLNAVLSFGYTLLGTILESLIQRVGLDPMLGVFHTPEYGRPSLMLDLIEEFRPVVVDSLMLRLVNRRELVPEDFDELQEDADAPWGEEDEAAAPAPGSRGVWLNESGRRVFFRAWGRRLRETVFYEPRGHTLSLEQIMEQQVYHLARVVKGVEPGYRSFVPR